ncbi:hypothetical protein RND71_024298 [Anisodus tanguticus]|uniref:Uncharacterized protein n=1 Tax=Anisodus tanguticus TaxID=243964 RepID=A0AAE1V4T5_9SOLA|nr:hypothetical protein RND71_024298 [Anisodus tanguticus]
MSALCTSENIGQFSNYSDLNDIEYSTSDTSDDLLMSFLEEPQFEASDEELLRSVIESLEAKNIAPCVNTNGSFYMDCSTPSDDDMNNWSTDYYSENGIEDLTNFLGGCREYSWEEPCESMLYE